MKNYLAFMLASCLWGGTASGAPWRSVNFTKLGFIKKKIGGEAGVESHLEVGAAALADQKLGTNHTVQFAKIARAVALKAQKQKHKHKVALQRLSALLGEVSAALKCGSLSESIKHKLQGWRSAYNFAGGGTQEQRVSNALMVQDSQLKAVGAGASFAFLGSQAGDTGAGAGAGLGRVFQTNDLQQQLAAAQAANHLASAQNLARRVPSVQQPDVAPVAQHANDEIMPLLQDIRYKVCAQQAKLPGYDKKFVKKSSWHPRRWFFGAVAVALLVDGIVRKKKSSPVKIGKALAMGGKLLWKWIAGEKKHVAATSELSADEQQELLKYMLMAYDPELTEEGEVSQEQLLQISEMLSPEEREEVTRRLLASYDPEMIAALDKS